MLPPSRAATTCKKKKNNKKKHAFSEFPKNISFVKKKVDPQKSKVVQKV